MSKKLLNESTIRRFAGLAGIGADVVSNFINEAYGEEEMEEGVVSEEEAEEEAEEEMDMMDMDADADEEAEEAEEEADMDMDMDMDAEEEAAGDDAEAIVSDIVAKLQDLAKMAGVDIDVEMDDEAEELDEMGMKYKRDEEPMEEAEETLEEIINGILAEESEELEEANCGSKDRMEEAEELEEGEDLEEGSYGAKARERSRERDRKSAKIRQEQEEVVQEVLRRVRERLAQKTEQ